MASIRSPSTRTSAGSTGSPSVGWTRALRTISPVATGTSQVWPRGSVWRGGWRSQGLGEVLGLQSKGDRLVDRQPAALQRRLRGGRVVKCLTDDLTRGVVPLAIPPGADYTELLEHRVGLRQQEAGRGGVAAEREHVGQTPEVDRQLLHGTELVERADRLPH